MCALTLHLTPLSQQESDTLTLSMHMQNEGVELSGRGKGCIQIWRKCKCDQTLRRHFHYTIKNTDKNLQ